jgi:phosphatidate cytidylyltransferase
MSPATALHSPIFRAYFLILIAVLCAAGILLAVIQLIFKKDLGAIWSTYRSWLVMGPICALVIFLGRAPFISGVTLIAILAAREFAIVSKLERATSSVLYAGIIAIALRSLASLPTAGISALVVALILLLPILRNRAEHALRSISLGLVGFLYLGWMFGHLSRLTDSPNALGYICFLLFATEVNDVAAFTFGRLVGHHPLRSEISPAKTWEGAIGALVVSLALPFFLRFSFPLFGPWQLMLVGLIIGIGGQLGDLSISLLKREFAAKDMGNVIPGHGGVLDRIDSLIFTAPLFTQLVFYYDPWR